jgi:hypothetical protein
VKHAERDFQYVKTILDGGPAIILLIVRSRNGRVRAEDVALFRDLRQVYDIQANATILLLNASKASKNKNDAFLDVFRIATDFAFPHTAVFSHPPSMAEIASLNSCILHRTSAPYQHACRDPARRVFLLGDVLMRECRLALAQAEQEYAARQKERADFEAQLEKARADQQEAQKEHDVYLEALEKMRAGCIADVSAAKAQELEILRQARITSNFVSRRILSLFVLRLALCVARVTWLFFYSMKRSARHWPSTKPT